MGIDFSADMSGENSFLCIGDKKLFKFLYIRVGLFKVLTKLQAHLLFRNIIHIFRSFRPFYLILRTVYMVRISQRNMDLSAWNLSEPGFN